MSVGELRILPTCAGCCCLMWLIFAAVAIGVSIGTLEQGAYALRLTWSTQQIDDVVESEPGIKMLGFGNTLLEFPSTFQTMYFVRNVAQRCTDQSSVDCSEIHRPPIKARSRDGLEMTVSISFQWRLQPQSLKPLYEILGHDLYKDEFVRFARAGIVHACSKFTANQYFTNRTAITGEMFDLLSANFQQPERGLQVSIKDVQMREVDLPDQFDLEIANTQAMMQEVQVAQAEREQRRIGMEREILVSIERVQQTIQEAQGQAEKVRVESNATVTQMFNFQRRQALANAKILQSFENGTDPVLRLFEYMKVRAVEDHKANKLLVNV